MVDDQDQQSGDEDDEDDEQDLHNMTTEEYNKLKFQKFGQRSVNDTEALQ